MKNLCALFLLLAAAGMSAQTQECVSLSLQALDLSGLNQSVEQEIQTLVSDDQFLELAASGNSVRSDFLDLYKKIIRKNFDLQGIKKEILSALAAHCQAGPMRQVIEQLKSPFIAHMVELESAIYTPEGRLRAKRYADALSVAPPTDERMRAVQAIDESLDATGFQVDLLIGVTRAMVEGLPNVQNLPEVMEKHRRELRERVQNVVLASLLLTYRGVPRGDLERYAQELRSEPLKGFYAQAKKAYLEVIENHARGVGQDLKAAVPPRQN